MGTHGIHRIKYMNNTLMTEIAKIYLEMDELPKVSKLIYILIKELSEQYPDTQISKTVVQRIMYLIEKELKLDLGFSMYHYGPHSAQVSYCIDFIEELGLIDVSWDIQKGYSITIKENKKANDAIKDMLTQTEKSVIKEVVRKYGSLEPVKLFMVTTALFVRDEFGVKAGEQLIETVKSLKPEYSDDYIKTALKEVGIEYPK
jgi:hypothetical protein